MNSASLNIYGVFCERDTHGEGDRVGRSRGCLNSQGARVLLPSELPCGVNEGEVCPTVNEAACFICVFCIKVLSKFVLVQITVHFKQKLFLKKEREKLKITYKGTTFSSETEMLISFLRTKQKKHCFTRWAANL